MMLDKLNRTATRQPMEMIDQVGRGVELLFAAGEARPSVVLLGCAGWEFWWNLQGSVGRIRTSRSFEELA